MRLAANSSTRIYFAGPDVFLPDYDRRMGLIKDLCRSRSLTALLPGDPELMPDAAEPSSQDIFQVNLDLIKSADGVVANLMPFRGPVEPDSGTVFECGYGYAAGKFVIGVVPDRRDLITRLGAADGPSLPGGRSLPDGSWVEDYGHCVNLMVAHCLCHVAATLEEAVDLAASKYRPAHIAGLSASG